MSDSSVQQARPNGQRNQSGAPAKVARRRGKPYNPAGSLGLPTKERLAKSHGFDEVNLAAGDGPKVPRSAEKMPFTPQAVRIRIVAEEIEAARTSKVARVPDPQRRLTPLDKALEDNEFESLDWFVEANYRRHVGRPTAMRYDDTPSGRFESSGDDSREKRWRINLAILSLVDDILPEAHKEFLDVLTHMVHSDFREGKPVSQLEIGQMILRLQGKDAATGAFRGYTRAVAQAISSARADAIVIMKRRRDAREIQMRDERKQRAGSLFKA